MPQGAVQLRVPELEGRGAQGCRVDARAGEQERVRHFAEGDAQGEGRRGQDCRAAQHLPQRPGEFAVGDRLGGHGVDRTAQRLVRQRMPHDAHHVVEGDPAHVLVAGPQHAAHPQLERQQHLRQGAAGRAEHDPNPQVHHADARVAGRRRRGFPAPGHLRQETGPRRRRFVEQRVSAVTVETDGRRRNQHPRRRVQGGQRLAEAARAVNAAVTDARLAGRRPTPAGNVLPRQVHHGIDAVQRTGRERAIRRVPGRRVRSGGRRSPQAPDAVAVSAQRRRQRRPDQPA